MSLKEFNKNFGIKSSVKEEQEAFINRSNQYFESLSKHIYENESGGYEILFQTFCIQLGLNPRKAIDENRGFLDGPHFRPEIHQLLPPSFLNTLKLWVLLFRYYKNQREYMEFLEEGINNFLGLASVDLGISYSNGMFYPKGEEVLDQDLINHSLQALAAYPNEDKDLRNALDNYRMGKKDGVIETCYRCMEGLAKQILNNNQTLIDNKGDLLKTLNLSESWKSLLNMYIKFGNDFGRHANANRHAVTEEEVEAYLYETCILIRLLVRTI